MMILTVVPITLRDAKRFVDQHHRHNVSPRGWRFGCGLVAASELVGVGIAGRPISRHQQDGWTIEILRICTIVDNNACSMLYGRLRRAAKALGFTRAITYTRIDEPGTSLRAAGFSLSRIVEAESWDRPGRRRVDQSEVIDRYLWEARL